MELHERFRGKCCSSPKNNLSSPRKRGPAPASFEICAGALLLAVEVLLDIDVAGLFQRRQMRAEIAFGGANQRLKPHKFDLFAIGKRLQRRHDPQTYRLMDGGVGLLHHTVLSQMPPRI